MHFISTLRPYLILMQLLKYGSLCFIFACSKTDNNLPPSNPTVQFKSYYISQNGNDNDSGSKEKPFRTFQKLNSIDLQPGEQVYLDANSTFIETLVLDTNDYGTKELPVIVSSYGNGKTLIDGGNKEAIVIKSQYVFINNIDVKGAGRKDGNTSSGIVIQKAAHVKLENILVEGFQKSGVLSNQSHNIELKKITARKNGFSGIYVTSPIEQNGMPTAGKRTSKYITIRDCLVENNPGDPTEMHNHSGNGILIERTDNALIDHCVATNNGWDMPHAGTGPIGIWTSTSDSVIIQYCISYDNKTALGGFDGGGFGIDGGVTNSIIQYCLSYNNYSAGYGIYQYAGTSNWTNNILRYNISFNDAYGTGHYGSLTLWNGTNDSKLFTHGYIYNNLFINKDQHILKFLGIVNNENFYIANNIFIGNGNLFTGVSTGSDIIGNIYWNAPGRELNFKSKSEFELWANTNGFEKLNGEIKGKMIDPLIVGPLTTSLTDPYKLNTLINYKLQLTSPLRNGGLNLAKLYNSAMPLFDFYGNKVFSGNAPEPGIHELNE